MNTRSLFVHLAIYLIHANQIKPTSSGSHRCYGLHPPFQHLPRQEQRESGDHDNLGWGAAWSVSCELSNFHGDPSSSDSSMTPSWPLGSPGWVGRHACEPLWMWCGRRKWRCWCGDPGEPEAFNILLGLILMFYHVSCCSHSWNWLPFLSGCW